MSKFFNIAVGRSKSLSEGHKKASLVTQTFFSIVSDRIFKYPQTDLLCATLFDVLLGGASPKQVACRSSVYFIRVFTFISLWVKKYAAEFTILSALPAGFAEAEPT